MDRPTGNESAHGAGCVQCGRVDSPIRAGPGPGWLALLLWAAAAALWTIGMVLEATWLTYPAAAVFLGALIYTLWYFARREEVCRHCSARWDATGQSPRT